MQIHPSEYILAVPVRVRTVIALASPVGLSSMTKLAPPRYVSQVMGVWFLALALGNNLAGQLSRQYDAANLESLPALFLKIFWWTAGAAILMYCLSPRLERLLKGPGQIPAP